MTSFHPSIYLNKKLVFLQRHILSVQLILLPYRQEVNDGDLKQYSLKLRIAALSVVSAIVFGEARGKISGVWSRLSSRNYVIEGYTAQAQLSSFQERHKDHGNTIHP